jgi:4-hydroxythreonine-4-phosphate dehydrogenase
MTQLALTLGDPAGIGPEVILKTLAKPGFQGKSDLRLTIVGTLSVLEDLYQKLKGQVDLADPDTLDVLDVPLERPITLGCESASSGEASFRYLERAIDLTLAGKFAGVVTGPIAKSAWKKAGHFYPGQTEYLAERSGTARSGMAFLARSPHNGWVLRMLLATTHIPLRSVPEALTPELLSQKLELLLDYLAQDFAIAHPWVAIAGLNPHSGEQGQLGQEELTTLQPWLDAMRLRFPQARLDGLIPPDTLWVRPAQAWYAPNPSQTTVSDATTPQPAGNTAILPDAYLALYHDQGLIPVKALAFDRAVNTTIGLPFVRTSPDHGTAFDIAGQGRARAESFGEAIAWAIQLAKQRLHGQ